MARLKTEYQKLERCSFHNWLIFVTPTMVPASVPVTWAEGEYCPTGSFCEQIRVGADARAPAVGNPAWRCCTLQHPSCRPICQNRSHEWTHYGDSDEPLNHWKSFWKRFFGSVSEALPSYYKRLPRSFDTATVIEGRPRVQFRVVCRRNV